MKSLAKLLSYIGFFSISLIIFVGGNAGDYFFNQGLDGRLGLTTSELVSKVIEILISLLSALVASGVFSKSPWMSVLIDTLGPLFIKPESSEDKFNTDVLGLIAHAVSQQNKDLTTVLCETLAGTPYLTKKDDNIIVTDVPRTG